MEDLKIHRYKELDVLRGIAVLLVMFFHFTMGKPQEKLGFNLGNTGVDLFFMISGFVIFMSILKVKSSKEFILNRFYRLYPTYWIYVTITFCIIIVMSEDALITVTSIGPQYLVNMTMLQHFFKVEDLDGPYWTLAIELIFYAMILFMYKLRLLSRFDIIAVLLIIFTMIAYNFKQYFIIDKLLDGFPLLGYLPLFFSGILFYKMHVQNKTVMYYILLCFCLGSQIYLFNFVNGRGKFLTQYEYAAMLGLYFLIFLLFVHNKLTFISKATPLLYVGKISYQMYLIHQCLALNILIPFFNETLGLDFWVSSFVLSTTVIITLVSIISHYIEKPFISLIKGTTQVKQIHTEG